MRHTKKTIFATEDLEVSLYDERLLEKAGNGITLVLLKSACEWKLQTGGCYMCAYSSKTPHAVQLEEVENQLNHVFGLLEEIKEPYIMKVYDSGSFFYDKNREVRNFLAREAGELESLEEFLVESTPAYITSEKVRNIQELLGDKKFIVALGLETVDDETRRRCINKPVTFNSFKEAAKLLHQQAVYVKAYLLQKPPFLTEKESILDIIHSVDTLSKIDVVASIGINPVSVYESTLVYKLWKEGKYKPAWLWSVQETIKHALEATDKVITQGLVKVGTKFAPRNCGKCDEKVVDSMVEAILSQDPSVLNEICPCKKKWLKEIGSKDLTREP